MAVVASLDSGLTACWSGAPGDLGLAYREGDPDPVLNGQMFRGNFGPESLIPRRRPQEHPPVPRLNLARLSTSLRFQTRPPWRKGRRLIGGTVCAVIGKANLGLAVELPLNGITSLILDMGSGQEIVDGDGADLKVFAAGCYTVALANTPFAPDFEIIPGIATGEQTFDLGAVRLSTARYVRIVASPTVTLDAVKGLNVLYDETFLDDLTGQQRPAARADAATIKMRREKAPVTNLDHVLELIAPDGSLFGPIGDSGFGDTTSLDLSDAALINKGTRLSSLRHPETTSISGAGCR
mgnify:CR=1 FL=1